MTLGDRMAVLAAGTVIESGDPETLYREPRHAQTMALVGFPPANFLRGTLTRRGDSFQCDTRLFSFPVDVSAETRGGEVFVGVRPERIHISHRMQHRDREHGPLQTPATVMLREDLGGEDIVYLAASGEQLTMVDRDHYRGDDLDEQVSISIFPHHLTLFDATSGAILGRGLRHAGASTMVSAEVANG
jgi:ABC-type sugar transport system ATPase subunit